MRRVIFYLFFDPQGRVDDYVTHKLMRLRPFAEHIFVVSNSALDAAGRDRLNEVADTVWERENVGFDVWAYKEAMTVFGGVARLQEYDEVVLMNYTFFGPVGTFEDLFARMDAEQGIDFWGVTDHAEVRPHPFTEAPVMRAHIQSHWIAMRRSLVTSDAFRTYWSRMPMIESYLESVIQHESRFTHYFATRGFTYRVAFPEAHYDTDHPIVDSTVHLLRDGCPIVKRRNFFHDPLYFEMQGVGVVDVFDEVVARGYPGDLILQNLARTSKPRELMTNLALLEILPHQDCGYDVTAPLRIVAIAHIYYPEMTDEIIDRFDCLPGEYDLVVTTGSDDSRALIEETLARRGRAGEVRIVGSNRGRDIAAFFIDCRDVLTSDRYDLVVKLHSKRSPQDGINRSEVFKRHLFDNLLPSPGYARNLVRLFQEHPTLGIVMPPVIHHGYQTLGHSWYRNRKLAESEAERLGILVPFDDHTPVATYGSMFVARPAALRPIVDAGYTHDDFPDESGYSDGALSHVVERLVAYGSLSEGLHVREVLNPTMAALDYKLLEYRTQALSSMLPGNSMQQLDWLRNTQDTHAKLTRLRARHRALRAQQSTSNVEPAPLGLARVKAAVRRHPRLAAAVAPGYRRARRIYGGFRAR